TPSSGFENDSHSTTSPAASALSQLRSSGARGEKPAKHCPIAEADVICVRLRRFCGEGRNHPRLCRLYYGLLRCARRVGDFEFRHKYLPPKCVAARGLIQTARLPVRYGIANKGGTR